MRSGYFDDAKQSAFQVKTPAPGDEYQVKCPDPVPGRTCMVWTRFASFIEVGGRTGLGYRDILAVVHTNPAKCRQRIVELFRGQVQAG
jgi:N,N'-diacetylchitobiose phosphorylase